ncbi:HAD family hydrolase [Clostridium tyrobutyricum]|uniref:HAD family hydrolase n=1 Tax=Clostridium tyrobutyricum TaxID=1519 RepID=UPI001C385C61|nr:HAD family hydrolase [Clostridium tyrobutyricum]MBV4430578.1 HAD family hydrolase [Clostridium tyrobutyricum]MBV4437211.1 HAD family hydrolase [Clostridium tyrobutyricum]
MKAIIFDLDDTLYREKDFVEGAFKYVCKYLSMQYELNVNKLYEDINDILKKHGRGRIFNILCRKYNIVEDINTLVNIYRNSLPQIDLYEDAVNFFEKYSGKYSFGIITDGKASVQWNKIGLLNLKKYVDGIIVTHDYGKKYWKPNSFVYLKMAQYFECRPEECVYIGDNPNKDFIGARAIGMNTIRIIRKSGDHMNTFLDSSKEADFNINSMDELQNIIENRM